MNLAAGSGQDERGDLLSVGDQGKVARIQFHGGGFHGGFGGGGFRGGGFRRRGFGGYGFGFYYGGYYPYAYNDYYDDGGCYLVRRRVMTPYGWRIRPVQVCG